jgi:hypothetical protein
MGADWGQERRLQSFQHASLNRVQTPRSFLVALLEETADVLGLGHGQHRLELIFEDGRLRSWFAHAEKRKPGELAALDHLVADLLERARVRAAGV